MVLGLHNPEPEAIPFEWIGVLQMWSRISAGGITPLSMARNSRVSGRSIVRRTIASASSNANHGICGLSLDMLVYYSVMTGTSEADESQAPMHSR